MDRTLSFRRHLTTRILRAAVVTLPTAPLIASIACGGGGGTGGSGGAAHMCSKPEACFAWPLPGTTSSTRSATSSTSSATSSTSSAPSGTPATSGSGSSSGSSMMPTCPTVQAAPANWNLTVSGGCNVVVGPITNAAGMCCYQFVQGLGTG